MAVGDTAGLCRRGVAVTVDTGRLPPGLGLGLVGSRLVWGSMRGFAFSTCWPGSQTCEATIGTLGRKVTAAEGMTTVKA